MAFKILSARATALSALLGALLAPAAMAADMPFLSAPAPQPMNEQPLEFGSGWYLRGDVGYSNMSMPVVVADFVNNLGRTGAVSGGLGFGYQYNSWLRTDFTVDRSVFQATRSEGSVWCPYGTVVSAAGGTGTIGLPEGYLYSPQETCTPLIKSTLNRTSFLANAYIDLGNWWGFTPYAGAGLGFSYLQSSGSDVWYQNGNGQAWAPNLGQGGVPVGWVNANGSPAFPPYLLPFTQILQQGYNEKKVWKFAWNFMAGVSYDITQNLKIDLHYRLLDAGSYTSFTGFPSPLTGGASAVTRDLISQEVRMGFRLVSD